MNHGAELPYGAFEVLFLLANVDLLDEQIINQVDKMMAILILNFV